MLKPFNGRRGRIAVDTAFNSLRPTLQTVFGSDDVNHGHWFRAGRRVCGNRPTTNNGASRRLRFVIFRPAGAARRARGASVDTCDLLSPRISPGMGGAQPKAA